MIGKERGCDKCGEIVRFKQIKKINGNYYCRLCAIEIRKNHRKETYENSEDKENIKRLTNELKNRSTIEKRRIRREEKQSQPPKPKGFKKTRVDKNHCYISLQEKQNLFRILVNRGLDSDDAKERISNLIRSQKELKEKMLNQKKSEKEIKIKQQEMLEELWNY